MGVITDLVEEVVHKVGDHVQKQIKKNKANRKLRKDVEASVARAVRAGKSPYEEEFRDASLQEVLAMSVDGVYYRDHSGMDLNLIVKPLVEGEYEVDERMAHFTSSLYWSRLPSISEEEEKAAGIKHYVRRPCNPSASAPGLIIAIRGTKLTSIQDLADDVKIARSTIGFSSRLKQGEDLVKKIIQEYTNSQREDHDYFSEESSSDGSEQYFSRVQISSSVQHCGVQCDVCNITPIIGNRYKSNKIEDYDLCHKCFLKHGSSRDYSKIDTPLGKTRAQQQYREPYDSEVDGDDSQAEDDDSQFGDSEAENDMSLVLSRQLLKAVQHPRVACDICKISPIVGIRYKSITKKNYDLCQECFQEHGALKSDYIKMEKPLEGASSSGSAAMASGDIYITGHSLGAALALQIGKKLAVEEKQRYNVHCFNPPFLTIVQLIQEGIFISKAKQMLRKSPLEPLINVASHVKNLTKLTLAMMMDEGQLVTEVEHFMSLIDWVPVLYINAHDNICKRFKKHYKLKQKVSAGFEVCSQALVSQVLGRRAVYSSLVPSVDMFISKLSDDPHAIRNWYRSPRIDKFCQYRLLPGVYFAGLPIHSLAKSILDHPDSDQEEESDLDVQEITYY